VKRLDTLVPLSRSDGMHRFMQTAGLGLAVLAALSLAPSAARAQYVQLYSPPVVVASPPVVSYYAAPRTVYYSPAPVTYSYYAPATYSYYAPATTVYASPAPVTYSYYAPTTTVYAAPAAAVTPGYVTTRSYYGLGIFRPRGWTTESYFTPTTVAAPVTSYYTPVFIR
jgi:hypothetical protein